MGAISGTRSGPSWLALPARDTVGGVRVYDMHLPQAVVQAELRAHKTPLVGFVVQHGGIVPIAHVMCYTFVMFYTFAHLCYCAILTLNL